VTESDNLRIGTAEREAAVKILSEHLSAGRLTLAEYEQRMSAALESLTRADLRGLFTDLPEPHPAFMAPPPAVTQSPLPAYYPAAGPPDLYSERYRVVAGVLQIVFPFGVGRFYTGHTKIAVAQLLTSIIAVGVVWSFIDGIIMLVNGGTDVDGRDLRL
jgi:hypothetical protein